MVIGEAQILGQVRGALGVAQASSSAGRVMNAAFQRALRVGKLVHTQTGIDRSGASVMSVALDAATEAIGPLASCRVVVVGAGSMGSLAVSTLTSRGVERIVVANRGVEAGARLASQAREGRSVSLSAIDVEIGAADLLIFCVGAAGILLEAGRLVELRKGSTRPLGILDLALPHDTDPDVGRVPGVTRIDLAGIAARSVSADTQGEVAAAGRIVAAAAEAFLVEQVAAQVEPTVVALRAHAGDVVEAEIQRLRSRLTSADDQLLAEVERSMHRAMNALLHIPTVRLKEFASGPDGDRFSAAILALFDLPREPSPAAAAGSVSIPSGSVLDLNPIQLESLEVAR
jgi:glutamyl-tRNA reductase